LFYETLSPLKRKQLSPIADRQEQHFYHTVRAWRGWTSVFSEPQHLIRQDLPTICLVKVNLLSTGSVAVENSNY
jgi:hypothetical protein